MAVTHTTKDQGQDLAQRLADLYKIYDQVEVITDGNGRELFDVHNTKPERGPWPKNSDPVHSIRMAPIWKAPAL